MPTSQLKSLAKEYNVPMKEMEKFWKIAKEQYDEEWPRVVGAVKKMAQNYKKSKNESIELDEKITKIDKNTTIKDCTCGNTYNARLFRKCPKCKECNKDYDKIKKESLDEENTQGLVKAYEEGKKAGKKWNNKDKVVNPYQGETYLQKAWREGFEDGAYPSEARRKNPYLNEELKKYKDHWSVRCQHCGHPLSGRPSTEDEGYSQKCNACGKTTSYDLKESLSEARSQEEQERFDKIEKQVADKMGLTLPLPKDTPREVRNKLYAQVNAKMKKSNVDKTLDKLK